MSSASVDKVTIEEQELPKTICGWAVKILNTVDPNEKVDHTNSAGKWWRSLSDIEASTSIGSGSPPDMPPRPESFELISPSKAPKRGKAGSLNSRITILHSLANVEQWAVDTAWDNIVRFGSHPNELPRGYYDDFVKMALDEAKHFGWLTNRIEEMGAKFGDLPMHAAIWESANETKHFLPARLAIVHMVHEARGLDVNPSTIRNFQKANDLQSSEMLEKILEDEITHVEIGTRWFKWYCKENQQVMGDYLRDYIKGLEAEKEGSDSENNKDKEDKSPENTKQEDLNLASLESQFEQLGINLPPEMLVTQHNNLQITDPSAKFFHALVASHFYGKLKPPFNYPARDQAGLDRHYYEPIAQFKVPPTPFAP